MKVTIIRVLITILCLIGPFRGLLLGDQEAQRITRLTKYLKTHPNDTKSYFALGKLYFEEGNYQNAMKQFWEVIRLDSEHSQVHGWLGLCFIKRGFNERGKIYLLKHEQNIPSVFMHWGKAEIFLSQSKLEEAKQAYLEAVKEGIQEAQVYFQLARLHLNDQEFSKSLAALDKGISLGANKKQGLLLKGDILFRKGNYREALKVFQAIIEIDDKQVSVYRSIAKSFEKLGDYQNALVYYDLLISNGDEHDIEALLAKGFILLRLEDYAKALVEFQKVVDIYPKHARAHTYLGIAQQRLGDYNHAFQSFNRAIELDPKNPEIHYYLGNAYFEKGEHLGAIVCGERALLLSPNYTRVYRKLALANHLSDNESDALKYLKKAIEIPLQDDILTPSFGAYYQNALELRLALEWFQKMIKSENIEIAYLYHYGEVSYKLGQQDSAVKTLESKLKGLESEAPLHRLMGQMLEENDRAAALKHFQQYLSYRPESRDAELIKVKINDLKTLADK